jgi:hypothetical protein
MGLDVEVPVEPLDDEVPVECLDDDLLVLLGDCVLGANLLIDSAPKMSCLNSSILASGGRAGSGNFGLWKGLSSLSFSS